MIDALWIDWRAAGWWRVGYSNGLSGEELANPDQLDEQYREDYERGLNEGRGRRAWQA